MERMVENFANIGRRVARPASAAWEPSGLSIADLIRQVDLVVAHQKARRNMALPL
jgi:hypothetical protein